MIKEAEHIEIPLSKIKMVLALIGALAFVVIGLWFIINPPEISHGLNRRAIFCNPIFLTILGSISVLFFGLIAVVLFRKLFDKKAGLIINSKGIIDNSSGLSGGLVLWADIEDIVVVKVNRQKFIMFTLRNPQDYLDKATNRLKRKGMEINYKWYGGPISISANSLQIDSKDLYELLTDKMKEYKK